MCWFYLNEVAAILQLNLIGFYYNVKMENMVTKNKRVDRYRVWMHVEKLTIKKNIKFNTKIIWKRNDTKIQTKFSTHAECQSKFDESLQLDFNLIYNQQTCQFQSKQTEIIVIVFYEGNIKSGGLTHLDISRVVNQQKQDQQVNFILSKCPDPTANLKVRLNYKLIQEEQAIYCTQGSELTSDQQQLSIIKFKSSQQIPPKIQGRKEKSLSLFQKHEQKQFQLRQQKKTFLRVNSLIDKNQKYQSLQKINFQQHSSAMHQMESLKQRSSLPVETQQQEYRKIIEQLQHKNEELLETIIELRIEHDNENRAYEEIMQQLREELEQKNELLQRSFYKLSQCNTQISNGLIQISQLDTISIFAYKDLYQKSLQELEQVKSQLNRNLNAVDTNNQFNQSFSFKNFSIMDNISEINQIGECEINHTKDYTIDQEIQIREERIENLQRQNTQLQVEFASISHKIGQIFNAALQFGGPKLLDHLQSSIGLIE